MVAPSLYFVELTGVGNGVGTGTELVDEDGAELPPVPLAGGAGIGSLSGVG